MIMLRFLPITSPECWCVLVHTTTSDPPVSRSYLQKPEGAQHLKAVLPHGRFFPASQPVDGISL